MPPVRTLAAPLAVLLVAAAPIVAIGACTSAGQWGRWLVRTGGVAGVVGLVVTGAATVNLGVPRTCGSSPDEVNRPVISLVLGDGDCFREALGQLALVGLTGVAASAGVVAAARRSRRGGAGAAPAAPCP